MQRKDKERVEQIIKKLILKEKLALK
jgi:hypothetical protein